MSVSNFIVTAYRSSLYFKQRCPSTTEIFVKNSEIRISLATTLTAVKQSSNLKTTYHHYHSYKTQKVKGISGTAFVQKDEANSIYKTLRFNFLFVVAKSQFHFYPKIRQVFLNWSFEKSMEQEKYFNCQSI